MAAKQRGVKLSPPPKHAPLKAHKVWEVMRLFTLSAEQLGERMGLGSGNSPRAWIKGTQEVEPWAIKVIAYEFNIPESWGDQQGVLLIDAVGKAGDKGAKLTSAEAQRRVDAVRNITALVDELKAKTDALAHQAETES